ncbi:MAG: MarR family transcriptional regulator [Ignavibacteriaceae bacterium]|nr:MarR family transcriptional regulator [Ignavibacteriaceae bacterium]
MNNSELNLPHPDQSIGFSLWQTFMIWNRKINNALAAIELTHTQFVLLAGLGWLLKEKEPVSQIRLAEEARTDPMMTSQVLRTLEKKGLITRAPHPDDSRAKEIKLTNYGTEMLSHALTAVQKIDEDYFGVLEESRKSFHWNMNELIIKNL